MLLRFQVPVATTQMPLMQSMMRPAMALAPTPPHQFAHMMRQGPPLMQPGNEL